MDETRYHAIADRCLQHYADALEPAYDTGALTELELSQGILTMLTRAGHTLLLSKHAPSRQLWLASPVAGGLHFSADAAGEHWHLADGRTLDAVLREELARDGVEMAA